MRYQSTDPRQNEIYLFYTITRTVWPYFVSEHHVDWAEWITFKQSCYPLNYRIIRKNFNNNNFKLTFIWEGISEPKILQHVNRFTQTMIFFLWSITRHYRISIGVFWTTISFLDTSQQRSSLFNLVEVTLNGLWPSFPFLRKFASVCLLLAKIVCKT